MLALRSTVAASVLIVAGLLTRYLRWLAIATPTIKGDSNLLCFVYYQLQIERTGGTALNAALVSSSLTGNCKCKKYRPGCCQSALLPEKCGGERSQVFQSRLTTGWRCGAFASLHAVQNCRRLPSYDKTRIITGLRNPIDRIISEYSKCRSRGFRDCFGEYTLNEHPSLEDYVLQDGTNWPYQNRQTKMLSGCPTNTTQWNDPDTARKCLDQAKRNIRERFFFVSIHEDFDFSLQALGSKIGEDLKPPKENVNRRDMIYSKNNSSALVSSTLAPYLKAKIAQKEMYDMELYQFARGLLYERYGKMKSDHRRE